MFFRHQPDGIDGRLRPAVFRSGHQPHVAFGKTLLLQFRHGPQYRYAGEFFDTAGENALVPLAGHPIQHHTADMYIGVEGHDTAHHRCHGAGGFGGIDAQDHRQAQQLGQFGGAGFPVGVDAVIKATVALDDGKVGLLGVSVIRAEDGVPVDEEGVQVVAGPAGRKGKPAGVNIIWTFFKR